jgi:phosphotransferase system HPr-like phosphotransfer protein
VNIGVGTKAHKKVKLGLKSNINVTKKNKGQMTAKSLIGLRKVGTEEGQS